MASASGASRVVRSIRWPGLRTDKLQHAQRVYVGLFLGYLFAPLAILVIFAFDTAERPSWPPQGLTLRWFGEAFGNAQLMHALANSLLIGVATTLLSLVVATLTAYGLTRFEFRGKRLLETINLMVIVMYGIVSAVALLLWLSVLGVTGGVWPTIVGHTTFMFPLGVLVIRDRLLNFDEELEYASMDLGASRIGTFLRITLPLITPALFAAALLIFLQSFGEFLLSFFLIGMDTTLPVFLASEMRFGLTPAVNAVATVLIAGPVIAVVIAAIYIRREVERSLQQ